MWPSWTDTWYYDIFSHSVYPIHTDVAFLDGQLVLWHFFPQYLPHPYLCGLLGRTTGTMTFFPTVSSSSIPVWPSWTDNCVLRHFSHSMYPIHTYVAFLDGQLGTNKKFGNVWVSVQEGHISISIYRIHTMGKNNIVPSCPSKKAR